jgi:hypothetical protein
MQPINLKRVLIGGLAAGLLVNATESFFNMVLVARDLEAMLRDLHMAPMAGGAIGFFVAWGFVQGLVTVWLYAALRARLGAGPRTAVAAGLLVWLLAYAFPALGNAVTGLAPWPLTLKTLAWALVEAPLVALAGAWLYRED